MDPEQFLDKQRQAWDSVADAWVKWWQLFEDGARNINEALIELAGIATGHRVLDLASGIGDPALMAAEKVAPDGHVLGIDLSSEMLRCARDRATRAGIDNVEFRVQDAAELSETDAHFDAALCRFGLMHMLDPVEVVRHVHRVLVPGGRFAVATWPPPEQVPFIGIAREVLLEQLQLPAPDPDAPGPFRLDSPALLTETLEAGGFVDVAVETLDASFHFESGAQYVTFLREFSSNTREALAKHPETVQKQALDALRERVEGLRTEQGIWFHNQVLCTVAVRAATGS